MSGYHDPFSKSTLLNRMHTDLELSGKMKRTQEAYLRAIRKLSEFLNLMPDVAVEDDLRRYILFAKNDKSWSSSSLNVAYNGIKFFYRVTCPRDWQTLRTLRVKHERKLPMIISTSEVKILLRVIDKPPSNNSIGTTEEFRFTLFVTATRLTCSKLVLVSRPSKCISVS